MTELLVGCPVAFRAWSLPAWFVAVERACRRAEVQQEFVFVGDPAQDPETWAVIEENATAPVRVVVMAETRTADVRDWGTNPTRYHRMVELRNELLAEVRTAAPQWFLSLDSDVILHPDALVNMLDTLPRYDAVGGKCYMTGSPNDRKFPSYAMFLRSGGLYRPDADGVFQADVLMAIKLMGPGAYAVDYRYHGLGEDIGWSLACKEAGVTLGWDGRVCSKHLWSPEHLHRVDERVGF